MVLRSRNYWSAYSTLLERQISVPSELYDRNSMNVFCSDIDWLYYIEASQTSVFLVSKDEVDSLIKLYGSGKCGNMLDDPWYWAFQSEMYEGYKPFAKYLAAVIDNSIPWKESIFVALEQQFAYGLSKKNVEQTYQSFEKYRIHRNPYRIDEKGFEGTVLALNHLHQAVALIFMGWCISFCFFPLEIKLQRLNALKRFRGMKRKLRKYLT